MTFASLITVEWFADAFVAVSGHHICFTQSDKFFFTFFSIFSSEALNVQSLEPEKKWNKILLSKILLHVQF